ncbi:phosphoribosyl-AMP cyclohydrolase [Flammeovirga sp. SubArs3]|uniref:phosphoribosyl-AMP cyclohydrolase n=1 Tax=Flammeovirga sp. SubArs3 TaxID=2995316 RepID=UPI00248AE3CD|nr:phosphoribosyl-AMP cyclohydrolase [Flammeovirga sp. SubArs3]
MVTKEQVVSAQNEWGAGVVKIGSLKEQRAECEAFANEFLDKLYSFEAGPVLFKPTKCAVEQFRPTKAEALSYFIAGEDRACAEDKGFAINPWTKVRFENSDIILEENRAIVMGNYFFTDLEGNEAKVEYTFGYKVKDGALKIDLHHSSFPYNPVVA